MCVFNPPYSEPHPLNCASICSSKPPYGLCCGFLTLSAVQESYQAEPIHCWTAVMALVKKEAEGAEAQRKAIKDEVEGCNGEEQQKSAKLMDGGYYMVG